jgi:hypothetical protein
MGFKKISAIFIGFILIICIFSSINLSATNIAKNNFSKQNQSNVIKGVPYVGQQTDFYCVYAAPAMIFKYYGINTTQYEVLFRSGGGYSLLYCHPKIKKIPVGCAGSSDWEIDRTFLAELYGLNYTEEWLTYMNISKKDIWNEYWNRIKENLSNNIPVLTWTDPTGLTSMREALRKEMNISEGLFSLIPEIFWNCFPSTVSHMIVLVGYNNSNGTICFNDPGTEVLNRPECGTYAWMNLTDFKNQLKILRLQSDTAYLIGAFQNTSNPPLNKTDAFEKALIRNIERMKGNRSVYDIHQKEHWKVKEFGIQGLKQLKNDLEPGLKNRISTILTYKFRNFISLKPLVFRMYKILDRVVPNIVNMSDFQSMMNYYYQFILEKRDIANYLENIQEDIENPELKQICQNNSILMRQEMKKFAELAENYSIFIEKGVFLSLLRAVKIMDNMMRITEELISIEGKIISS